MHLLETKQRRLTLASLTSNNQNYTLTGDGCLRRTSGHSNALPRFNRTEGLSTSSYLLATFISVPSAEVRSVSSP